MAITHDIPTFFTTLSTTINALGLFNLIQTGEPVHPSQMGVSDFPCCELLVVGERPSIYSKTKTCDQMFNVAITVWHNDQDYNLMHQEHDQILDAINADATISGSCIIMQFSDGEAPRVFNVGQSAWWFYTRYYIARLRRDF